MDAVQQFAKHIGVTVPENFAIGGASKVNQLLNLLSIGKSFFLV